MCTGIKKLKVSRLSPGPNKKSKKWVQPLQRAASPKSCRPSSLDSLWRTLRHGFSMAEIDGLPNLNMADFPWRTVSHNQMVYNIIYIFTHTHIITYLYYSARWFVTIFCWSLWCSCRHQKAAPLKPARVRGLSWDIPQKVFLLALLLLNAPEKCSTDCQGFSIQDM